MPVLGPFPAVTRLAAPLQTFSRSGGSMSPQAGDENGERGSQPLVCHSESRGCLLCRDPAGVQTLENLAPVGW